MNHKKHVRLPALPLLLATSKFHPKLAVLHLDAHTDTYAGDGNREYMRFNVATTFTRAAEEGVIDAEAYIHVGARGSVADRTVFEHTRSKGYTLIDEDEMFKDGFAVTAAILKDHLGDRSIYVCFDMDFFDPSCAPGVCTLTWEGASAREGLGFLRSLAGLNIVGGDINTVSPPHDLAHV